MAAPLRVELRTTHRRSRTRVASERSRRMSTRPSTASSRIGVARTASPASADRTARQDTSASTATRVVFAVATAVPDLVATTPPKTVAPRSAMFRLRSTSLRTKRPSACRSRSASFFVRASAPTKRRARSSPKKATPGAFPKAPSRLADPATRITARPIPALKSSRASARRGIVAATSSVAWTDRELLVPRINVAQPAQLSKTRASASARPLRKHAPSDAGSVTTEGETLRVRRRARAFGWTVESLLQPSLRRGRRCC